MDTTANDAFSGASWASYTSDGPYRQTLLQSVGQAIGAGWQLAPYVAASLGATVLLVGALMALPGPSAASDLPPMLRLQFNGKAPARVSLSEDRREVVLYFAGEVNEAAVKAAAADAGGELDGYTTGYGAARLRFVRPVQASLQGRTLEVQPDAAAATGAPVQDQRRLSMLEAQSLGRTNPRAAEVKLQDALHERPNDLDLLLALAGVQEQAGDWRQGLRSYERALTIQPDAADVARQRDALARQYGPVLHVDGNAIFGPGERDQLVRFGAELPLGEGWRGFGNVLTQHSTIQNLRQSGRDVAGRYDAAKVQGQFGLERDWSPAITTKADITAAPQTFGAGFNTQFVTRYGTTELVAKYHAPYWETLTSFAANARRDTVGIVHSAALGPWRLTGELAGLRYGIPRFSDVATGVGVVAGVTRALPASWMPLGWRAEVGYALDAEYLGRVQRSPSGASQANLPLLDIRTREVHTVQAEASGQLGPGELTVLAGYSVDRYGGSGPLAAIRFARPETSDSPLVFGVEVATNPSLDFKTRQLYRVGAFLKWRLGVGPTRSSEAAAAAPAVALEPATGTSP